ncbi:MAG: hypothetical protein WCA82_11105 [Jiangellales bacterium]
MTTYGPTSLTLAERLAATDLVARIADVELIRTEDDPASEHGRELGAFRLNIAEVIDGEPRETVDITVARRRDDDWPLPEKGEFLALVRLDESGRSGQLVHESAFPVSRDSVQVDVTRGLGGERVRPERVSLTALRDLLGERADLLRQRDSQMDERERSAFTPEHQVPNEMPDTHGLRDWLDVSHGEGGRSDEPLRAPRSQRPPDPKVDE